jgi:nucleotidyltransferase AbiEii toxin of type IV toxin-antitoxin system
VLRASEARAVADRFAASDSQIRRDHLISHLLAALSEHAGDQIIFFGGTALSRTLLPNGRLSEDIDLIARGSRGEVAEHLTTTLPRVLRREFPRLSWEPPLTEVRDVDSALLRTPEGLTVRLQLLDPIGYPRWPVNQVDLFQRYSSSATATHRLHGS